MNEKPENEELTNRQQWLSLAVGSLLCGVLVVALIFLIRLSQIWEEFISDPIPKLIVLASLGGLFGGSSRALFMFHVELGGHAEKPASYYLARWFLFLIKPFIGVASGTLFFLAANFGVRGALTDPKTNMEFLPTILIAAIGGIFFEEVFGVLHNLIRTLSSGKNQE